MEAALSAKTQILISKEAREALGIKPGNKVLKKRRASWDQ
jgi:bifunctional DNA-binding transcriptional regulator/antitoxin component of YhaV-PrlF toxin-antitoxin module